MAFAAAIAIVVAMDSLAGSALAADPAKTLRVVLTSAEQSFDPQFSADGGSDATSTGRCWGTNVDVDPAQRPK